MELRIHRDLIFLSSGVKAAGAQSSQSLHQGENSNLFFLLQLARAGLFSGPIFICQSFNRGIQFLAAKNLTDGGKNLFLSTVNSIFHPAKICWSAIFIASLSKPRFRAFRNAS